MIVSSISIILGTGGYTSNGTRFVAKFPLSSVRAMMISLSNIESYGPNSIEIFVAVCEIIIFSSSLSFAGFPSSSLSVRRSKSTQTSDIPERPLSS